MKSFFLILILTLTFLSNLLFGQKTDVSVQDSKITPTLTPTPTKQTLNEKIKGFKKNRVFNTKYDKFDDRTFVAVILTVKDETFRLSDILEKNNPPATDIYGIDLIAAFSFEGQEMKGQIDKLILRFSAKSRKTRWLNDQDLIVIADGERLKFGDGKHSGNVSPNRTLNESLTWTFPRMTLAKIANAKKVEMRVGNDEVTLKKDQLESLRDLISLSNPN